MSLNIKEIKQNYLKVYPIIDELVDVLYTNEINNLMEKKCETHEDKKIFLMFLIMYFYTYININENIEKNEDTKYKLKMFLSNLIHNPEKRVECIKLYNLFESSIKFIEN